MTLQVQVFTMLAMILSGIYVGVVRETYNRFKHHWHKYAFLTMMAEVLFWLTQTVLLFYVLYRVNNGELRVYLFFALLLGFSIYRALLQFLYREMLELFVRAIKSLIIDPIIWIVRVCVSVVLSLYRMLKAVVLFLIGLLMSCIKVLFRLLRWLIPKKVYINITRFASFCSTIVSNLKKWLIKLMKYWR